MIKINKMMKKKGDILVWKMQNGQGKTLNLFAVGKHF